MTVGLGPQAGVERAAGILRDAHGSALSYACFPTGDEWVIRVLRAECTKGAGLARVAALLGIARGDVAAVGDWLNDVEMLQWAGRSFAMPEAPEEVKRSASDVLERGGVADAIARWLGW